MDKQRRFTRKTKTKGTMKTPKYNFTLPSLSKPIHIETLQFCREMANRFREVERHNHNKGLFGTGFLANNSFSKEAGSVAMAYKTIAEHIEKEIRIRGEI